MWRLDLVPILFCLCLPCLTWGSVYCPDNGVAISATPDTFYNYTTSPLHPCNIHYIMDLSGLNDTEMLDLKFVLKVTIDPFNDNAWRQPLLISIRQQITITHVKLPFSFDADQGENTTWYYKTQRTLCFPKPKYNKIAFSQRDTNIHVSVDTANDLGLGFTLIIERSTGLLMHVGDTRSVTVNPMATTYFRFEFEYNPGVNMIEIIASSDDVGKGICTIVAIDDPFCPVYDLEENVARTSELKRMTSGAVTRIREFEFPKGLTIILIPLSTDKSCRKVGSSADYEIGVNREKEMSIFIRGVAPPEVSWMFAIQILGIFLPCLIGTLTLFCFFDRKLKRVYEEGLAEIGDEARGPMREPAISNIDELTYDGVVAESDTFGDRKRYHGYCTATCFVSVFYIIPVYQFLYYHWQSMRVSGDYDHCYYNELCRIRVEDISDFNHLISNLLYIVFGATFILLVYWRSWTLFNRKEYRALHRGLCVPFGAYTAMGLSLIMEGVLSSAYHFCPSSSTFQFDVAFMYVIAVILLSTIHQLRFHSSPSGTKAFMLLTFLTVISALFYYVEGVEGENDTPAVVARLVFAVSHILFMIFYCLGRYFHGSLKDEQGHWVMSFNQGVLFVLTPTRLRIKLRGTCLKMKELSLIQHPDPSVRLMRKIVLGLYFLLNMGSSLHLALTEDFAHYLLNLLIFNVVLALTAYISWKVFYWRKDRERPDSAGRSPFTPFLVQPGLYLTFGVLFFLCAFNKFNINLTEWRASAAESRALNQPCSQFWSNYYDHHDVWHFFSAVALFFFFMGILTIDDGIIMEDRKNIKIF